MMRRSIWALTALSILVMMTIAGPAFGQAQRGTITVTVTADDGSRLPGATVSAESDQTLTRRTTLTDGTGVASLVALDPAHNYVVTTTLDGFNGARNENVQVRAGSDFPIKVNLSLSSVKEELIVTAEAPIVDITSSIAGQDITLQLTESLPTQRTYQDYLQLVPGVMPAYDNGKGINPASRSGLNYRDLLGEVGTSRDNYYYLEGINITDGTAGLSRTNLNTEIIQEQSVLTGGLPAEFVGAPGLVSNVITKSGGNQFSGSVNYYFQNDSLVESDDHFEDKNFDTADVALTLGGPIWKDKAWFFGSFRNVNREDAFNDVSGQARLAEVDNDQAFLKLSFAPTGKDLLTGVFLSDPLTVSGQNNPNQLLSRDKSEERGGDRYMLNYSRVFSSAALDLGFTDHESDLNEISAIQEPLNDIAFRKGDAFTPFVDEQLGGNGDNDTELRSTQNARGSLEYFVDSSWGDHSIKFGADFAEYQDFVDLSFVDSAGEQTSRYVSLDARYAGQNINNTNIIDNFTIRNFNARNPSDYDGFMTTFATLSSTQQAAMRAAFDTNLDGVIDPDELADNMFYRSTAGNPDGQVNYGRREQIAAGAAATRSEGATYYLQDTWQWKRWSVNAGIRAEEWEHFADTGQSVFVFDNEIAPRLSVAYDLKGDGRQRLSFYYGRYYDPIRNNATQFVGSLTSRVLQEQVYVDVIGDWVSYRTRGGIGQLDATFAPTTATPYTDEYQIGYKRDLGHNMSIEANLIHRETRDIIEDYDFGLYTDPSVYPGPIDDPNSLFLGEGFFGFATTPTSNFNIATLPPGNYRDWDGVELIFRKRYSDNWQMLSSYNYADADGNTNSDSNFDFAGDVLWLDPRSPNQDATQPGLIEHLFKVAGSYNFDNGFQIGGAYRWNSGAIISRTQLAFRRHLPDQAQTFEFAGFTPGVGDEWIAEGAVGGLKMPSYGTLDARLAYLWNVTGRLQTDFFLDIFNILDEQEAVVIQDLTAQPNFGEGLAFVPPRRYFLGARLRF